jgi:thiamine-phosphate pyrophosphorylase
VIPVRGAGRPGIACVTDRRLAGDRTLAAVVRAAIAGGADRIQIREKDLGGAALLDLARELSQAVKTAGRCLLVVNDRLDVALAAKAAGVHLPAEGLPVAAARRAAGRKFLVGRSVHSLAEARQAEKEGADYLFFGPVFATPGKAAFGEPQGVAALRKVAEAVRVPVWAIGGVNPSTAPGLRGLPIAGVAAISAIIAAADPAEAVRALRAALEGTGPGAAPGGPAPAPPAAP